METLKSRVQDYFTNYFKSDFCRYFDILEENGMEFIANIEYSKTRCRDGAPTIRKKQYGFPFMQQEGEMENNDEIIDNGDHIDDIIFAACFSSLVFFQKSVWIEYYGQLDTFNEIIKKTTYPRIFFKEKNDIDDILKSTYLFPSSEKDKKLFLEIGNVVFPFMKDIFLENIKECNAIHHIEHEYDNYVFSLKRSLSKQNTLLSINCNKSDFSLYFENQFMDDVKSYFELKRNQKGYNMILFMEAHFNKRLIDGSPSDSGTHNIMFVCILLYMIIVEKSIDYVSKEHENVLEDFLHQSNWLLIYSGPGGGYMIDSMQMLKEAGLAPRPEETMFLLTAINTYFPFLHEKLYQIINHGKEQSVSESPFSIFKHNGHIKKNLIIKIDEEITKIKTYLYNEIETFVRLSM